MSSQEPIPEDNQTPEEKAALREFFKSAKEATAGRLEYAKQAPDAVRRLARAVYHQDSSQAQTVAACLASIYNGSEARPVRLDEIRWLDWTLQKDLLAVMIGTGHGGFEDVEIRKAFEEIGGTEAVEWFHWYTSGGPHRAALARIVQFIVPDTDCSSAGILRNALRSIYNGTTVLSVGKLTHVGERSQDMALVLDGIIGRDSGTIRENDIEDAFNAAGIPKALFEDVWPEPKALAGVKSKYER